MAGVALPIEFIELSFDLAGQLLLWVLNRFLLPGCGWIFCKIGYGYIPHRHYVFNGTLAQTSQLSCQILPRTFEPPEA